MIDGENAWSKKEAVVSKPSHPLEFASEQFYPGLSEADITIEDLTEELESIALDWKSVRTATECPCSTPLDFSSFKVSSYDSNGKVMWNYCHHYYALCENL